MKRKKTEIYVNNSNYINALSGNSKFFENCSSRRAMGHPDDSMGLASRIQY